MTGDDSVVSRRLWLRGLLAAWPAVLAAQQHAHHAAQSPAPASLAFFDAPSAADVEALASVILPSGATPGAREAGAIYFIDRALTTFDRDKQPLYHEGLAALEKTRLERFPGSRSFASLDAAQQTTLVQAIETTPFFDLVRFHTLAGFLADGSYGGNRNLAGWRLLGIDDSFHFEPPFGYYDAQEPNG